MILRCYIIMLLQCMCLMCLLSFVVEYLNAVRAKVGEVVSGIIMILCVCVCVCLHMSVCLSLSLSLFLSLHDVSHIHVLFSSLCEMFSNRHCPRLSLMSLFTVPMATYVSNVIT